MKCCTPAATRLARPLVVLSSLGLMWGCTLLEPQPTPINREVFRAQPTTQQHHAALQKEPAPRFEGSLFAGESGRSILFTDRKARLVNDVVTIRITESTNASGQATTNGTRESTVGGRAEGLFGFERTLRNNKITPASALSASLQNDFQGSGTTARRNSVTATVTAVVREVFPNGNLYIEGSKEVIINNERQYITLGGVVRPEDIGPDNSITSDQIADARMVYSGRGVISDKQRPGWLGRIVDFVWPF